MPLFVSFDQITWDAIHRIASSHPALPIVVTGVRYEELRNIYPLLEALPNFEETHYVPITEVEESELSPPGYARPFYWYPPAGLNWWSVSGYGYAVPPYVIRTERQIPEGTVALEEGAKVVSSDGEHVGTVVS